MKKSILTVNIEQFWRVPPVATADLTGQTVIVTGANTGLGFETAKHLARMGPERLILACRSREKGEEALESLRADTGLDGMEVWTLDQSKFSSVVAFVEKFEKEGGRLDILVANAGVAKIQYDLTEDGWEEVLQVNDLSTSLLCLLLVPRLVETGRKHKSYPRIVIVSSDTHYWVALPDAAFEAPSSFKYLSSPEYCTTSRMRLRYLESKLLNVFFMQSLSEHLTNTPIIVNAVTPGYCYSSITRNLTGLFSLFDTIRKRIMGRSTEEGARQIVYAAVGRSDHPEQLKGAYINLHEIREPSDEVLGELGKKRRDKLWKDLLKELSAIDTGGRFAKVVQELSL